MSRAGHESSPDGYLRGTVEHIGLENISANIRKIDRYSFRVAARLAMARSGSEWNRSSTMRNLSAEIDGSIYRILTTHKPARRWQCCSLAGALQDEQRNGKEDAFGGYWNHSRIALSSVHFREMKMIT